MARREQELTTVGYALPGELIPLGNFITITYSVTGKEIQPIFYLHLDNRVEGRSPWTGEPFISNCHFGFDATTKYHKIVDPKDVPWTPQLA